MTKTQKLQQELAMQDIEIAALKLEVLTQTEIAKNNKEAYETTNERLLTLQDHYTGLNEDCKSLEGKLIKAQAEIDRLDKNYTDDLLLVMTEKKEAISKLAKVPKWIQWLCGI